MKEAPILELHASATASTDGRTPVIRFLDRVIFAGLCLLPIFAALAFGAVEWWSLFVVQTGSVLLFFLWALRQSLSSHLQLWTNPLYLPILAFSAVVALQLVLSTTAYRYATEEAAATGLAYVLLFFVSTQSEEIRRRPTRILFVLVAFGSLLAVFSMIQSFSWNGKLYWIREVPENAVPWGPFVDRNHYAALMELLTPLAVVLALFGALRGAHRALLGFLALLMASTIFLSLSRGGIVALIAQFLLLGAWIYTRRRTRWTAVALLGLFVALVGFALWANGSAVVDRMATLMNPLDRGTAASRLTVLKDSPRMFAERPILGWGLGNFPTVYPRFRSYYSTRFTNAAHDDYLQLALETGTVGSLVVLFFLIQLYRSGWRRMANWRHSELDVVTLASLLACTGVLIHSFVEFPLQTPGVALVFALLCALATLKVRPAHVSVRARMTTEAGAGPKGRLRVPLHE